MNMSTWRTLVQVYAKLGKTAEARKVLVDWENAL